MIKDSRPDQELNPRPLSPEANMLGFGLIAYPIK